jgi:hypothetical protein
MTANAPLPPAPSRLLKAVALAAAGAVAGAFGQTTVLVGDSPFAPAGGALAAGGAPAQAYELAGSSVQGRDVLVCIFDRGAKHTDWIPVGATYGPIHVLSFDPANDRAVVTIAGDRRELALRKVTVASSGAAATERQPAPVAAAAPSVAAQGAAAAAPGAVTSAAREQQEARMLVSDLLAIGAQQRKAYQEAKKKAAQPAPQPDN